MKTLRICDRAKKINDGERLFDVQFRVQQCVVNLTCVCVFVALACLLWGLTSYNEEHGPEVDVISRETNQAKYMEEQEPDFPEDYHATGMLIMPHSNIAEPFEIWFAPSEKKSRIDYYYGTDRTYQRGDEGGFGKAYKYVPMYTDKRGSFQGCWTLSGTKNRPIVAQTITPNISWFKYSKSEVYTGALSTKWEYEYWAFGMKNAQSVWITKTKPYRPIRYEMLGFDTMLGSYYDHYVIEYISFEKWLPTDEVFQLPQDITCYNWSSSLESSFSVNPMMQFAAFSADRAVDHNQMYSEFQKAQADSSEQVRNKPSNASEVVRNSKIEIAKRAHVFKHNMRYISSQNRKNAGFTLKANHLADISAEEYETLYALEFDTKNHTGAIDLEKHEARQREVGFSPPPVEVPESLDWRDFGAVTKVKGQGICGACYAFTAAGVAEGAWFIKTGNLPEVSSQQIIDCSWGIGNHGCKGGHYAAGLSWIYSHGVSTDYSYGKFLAQEGFCHFNDTWFGAKIDGFSYVQPWNSTALKIAVAKYGPAAVSINSSPLSFKFYSRGVYDDPACSPNNTRHSVLVVGYGTENGQDYWLVKNSWSQSWGENGYMKVAMKDNLCGITENPIVAVIHGPTFTFPVKEKLQSESDVGKVVHSAPRPVRKPTLKAVTSPAQPLHSDSVASASQNSSLPTKTTSPKVTSPDVSEDFTGIHSNPTTEFVDLPTEPTSYDKHPAATSTIPSSSVYIQEHGKSANQTRSSTAIITPSLSSKLYETRYTDYPTRKTSYGYAKNSFGISKTVLAKHEKAINIYGSSKNDSGNSIRASTNSVRDVPPRRQGEKHRLMQSSGPKSKWMGNLIDTRASERHRTKLRNVAARLRGKNKKLAPSKNLVVANAKKLRARGLGDFANVRDSSFNSTRDASEVSNTTGELEEDFHIPTASSILDPEQIETLSERGRQAGGDMPELGEGDHVEVSSGTENASLSSDSELTHEGTTNMVKSREAGRSVRSGLPSDGKDASNSESGRDVEVIPNQRSVAADDEVAKSADSRARDLPEILALSMKSLYSKIDNDLATKQRHSLYRRGRIPTVSGEQSS